MLSFSSWLTKVFPAALQVPQTQEIIRTCKLLFHRVSAVIYMYLTPVFPLLKRMYKIFSYFIGHIS